MKKLILITLILFVGLVSNSWATTYMGSISNISPDNTLFGTQSWATNAILSWQVDDVTNAGLWTYSYTFSVASGAREISHVIIEVSSDFSRANIFSATPSSPEGPFSYVRDGSNPGMPDGGMFGLKWNTTNDPQTYSFTVVTNRMPMWGDFYAKDGVENTQDVYAYNLNFGVDTTAPIDNGNAGGWVLVPDTQTGVIPEPGTFLLLGTGLLGIAAIRYRRSKK